jgi:twitching motility protein PilT
MTETHSRATGSADATRGGFAGDSSTGPRKPQTSGASLLDELLRLCASSGASDLHLAPLEPPFLRIDGTLLRAEGYPELSITQVTELAHCIAADRDWSRLESMGAIDGAVTGPSGGRYRFNVFRRQDELAVAIRRLEDRIRSLGELGMPESLYDLAELRDGLVVVAGPTGSGKSTTLATLIDRINRTERGHIITIEDPIEYLHPSRECLVNQRQVGADTRDFYHALVASLRQDPDVILVGEIRELETIRTAITAAETGHLVFATVHAGDSVGVIERLVSVFPAEEQAGMRRQLSLVLRAVISQHLMIADGRLASQQTEGRRRVAPRVVASEVLRINSAVANLVATGKTSQIYSLIESGAADGMQTLDQDLARLVHKGSISERTAAAYARNPAIVQERLARLRSGSNLSAATSRAAKQAERRRRG